MHSNWIDAEDYEGATYPGLYSLDGVKEVSLMVYPNHYKESDSLYKILLRHEKYTSEINFGTEADVREAYKKIKEKLCPSQS